MAAGLAVAAATQGCSYWAKEVRGGRARPKSALPIYSLDEVRKHDSGASLWVTFRGGVYDLTGFYQGHPGGADRILMAAGMDMEPYWEVYRQHYRGHVIPWMERYRIGSLSASDAEKARDFTFDSQYVNDPIRHPDLLHNTTHPFNGEAKLERLSENYYTPNELHYVRNHLAVPDIDPEEYTVEVTGNRVVNHVFTLNDLKTKFKKYEVVSTLQCAGNRRDDFHGHNGHEIFIGPHWVVAAFSNAKWGGCRLRDVLAYCGLDVNGMAMGEVNYPDVKHIQYEGYDHNECGTHYGASFPIDKAVDPLGDCLLAYEMNGEDVPRDHGYPVRALVPGHTGCKQCKWLAKVIVSGEESTKSWHVKSYRAFAPDVTFDDLSTWGQEDSPLRLDQAWITQQMPVQSMVMNPSPNATLAGNLDTVKVKGCAWSGGGRGISRVDVSLNGGKTFTAAELHKPITQIRNRDWGWYQFSKDIPVPQDMKAKLNRKESVELELCSKAVSGDFNVQPPENPDAFYNGRGVCQNHWYRVPVTINPNLKADVPPPLDGSTDWWGNPFTNKPSGGKYHVPWQHEPLPK